MAELTKGVYPAPFKDPFADAETQPFWDATKEGRLTASRCTTCGTHLLPPQPRCYNCQGTSFEWVDLPGTGTIYTYTVVRHPLAPHLAEVVPYVSGVIQLDGTEGGGARMISNIIDCDPETVAVGDRVRVVFEQVSDALALPRFTPIDR